MFPFYYCNKMLRPLKGTSLNDNRVDEDVKDLVDEYLEDIRDNHLDDKRR